MKQQSLAFGCGLALIVGFLILPILAVPLIAWLRTLPDFSAFLVVEAICVSLLVSLIYIAATAKWSN